MSVRDEFDVRVAVIGNVDSGKSTLVGVLTKGIMDDGRARPEPRFLIFHTNLIMGGRVQLAKKLWALMEKKLSNQKG